MAKTVSVCGYEGRNKTEATERALNAFGVAQGLGYGIKVVACNASPHFAIIFREDAERWTYSLDDDGKPSNHGVCSCRDYMTIEATEASARHHLAQLESEPKAETAAGLCWCTTDSMRDDTVKDHRWRRTHYLARQEGYTDRQCLALANGARWSA